MNTIQLCYSDDGGYNWSQWKTKELGTTGSFMAPCTFRRLGRTKHRIWKIRDTSPYRNDIVAVSVVVRG